ncbi:MAG: type I pullulanase [Clostridia bacterium]|nr:type I pullulanase [Clostridia bacterium]
MRKKKVTAWITSFLMIVFILQSAIIQPVFSESNTVSVTIHYHRLDGNYDNWNIWGWIPGAEGSRFNFTSEDSYGRVASYTLENTPNETRVGFIIRLGEWEARDTDGDRFAQIKDGKVEVWLLQGESGVYFSEEEARAAIIPKLTGATMSSINKILVRTNIPFELSGHGDEGITIKSDDDVIGISGVRNPNAQALETAGYETQDNTVHFALVPGSRDVPSLDPNGGSLVYVAGTMNGWNSSGAEGWKMDWNPDKKYYELTKTLGTDINFGDEFKFINIVNGNPNWMSGNNIRLINQNITSVAEVTTSENLPLNRRYSVIVDGYQGESTVILSGNVLSSKEFDELFYYSGDDLGYTYSKEKTSFRVWAPLAEKVILMVYKDGDTASADPGMPYEMQKDVKGTWTASLEGDQNGIFYTYKVTNYGVEAEAGDPYAKAAGVNGDRSAVVDLASINPDNWDMDKKPEFKSREDAIIYELHIRDLAMDADSGIVNKGKYIQFKEEGTKGPGGISTGIDHIKELGVSHVHILPSFDYASIDEKHLEQNNFNFGYDPENFNVPEGSYSTDPYKPEVRIKEYKEMVQAFHKNGLRMVIDVVYNHTNDGSLDKFRRIVPGYYYRMREDGTYYNGSGTGNETASERAMVRKYIVDSVKYWINEYHVDGLRFDLMGIHDMETMKAVRAEADKIDPSIIIYGEGWDMGNLPREQRTIQPYAKDMPEIVYFNDNIRDNLKGPYNNSTAHGFVDGQQYYDLEVMEGVAGSIAYNDIVKDYNGAPGQSVNYVSCHDNMTLWDKISAANPGISEAERQKMHNLANTIVMTSQGIPFLHSGVEFFRTKQGVYDSFVSPDSINAMDWSEKAAHLDSVEFYKGLIALRKEHPAFRMATSDMIRKHLTFIPSQNNSVAYVIKDNANKDSWKNILVAYNANTTAVQIDIPKARWNVVVKGNKAGTGTIRTEKCSKLSIEPLSAVVMYTNEKIKVNDLFADKETVKTRLNSSNLTVRGKDIAAAERITQKDGVFYFPVVDIAKAIGAYTDYNSEEGLIKIRKGCSIITISTNDYSVYVKGRKVKTDYGTYASNDTIMVSSGFIEDLLGGCVLADHRRYNADTQRANTLEPDIYILY